MTGMSEIAPASDLATLGRGKAMEFCFVIGRPRSGTTVFKDMLKTHPRIYSAGEIFNESNSQSYFHFLQQQFAGDPAAVLPSNSIANFLKYLDWCRGRALERKKNARIVVADVKYDQSHLIYDPWWRVGSLPKIFFLIRERGWKVIDIHRSDIVGLVVSNQVAIQTKIYHSTALEPGARQSARVHINPDLLKRELATTASAYQTVSRHFGNYKNYLMLIYEEMFDSKAGGEFAGGVLERLCTFLRLEDKFVRRPKLEKLLADDVYAHIENAWEIRELVASLRKAKQE